MLKFFLWTVLRRLLLYFYSLALFSQAGFLSEGCAGVQVLSAWKKSSIKVTLYVQLVLPWRTSQRASLLTQTAASWKQQAYLLNDLVTVYSLIYSFVLTPSWNFVLISIFFGELKWSTASPNNSPFILIHLPSRVSYLPDFEDQFSLGRGCIFSLHCSDSSVECSLWLFPLTTESLFNTEVTDKKGHFPPWIVISHD